MKPAKLPPVFQQVFFTVVCLTLLSGGGSLWLSSKGNLSPEQTRVFETCNKTWDLGVKVVFGLLSVGAVGLLDGGKDENREP